MTPEEEIVRLRDENAQTEAAYAELEQQHKVICEMFAASRAREARVREVIDELRDWCAESRDTRPRDDLKPFEGVPVERVVMAAIFKKLEAVLDDRTEA